MAASAQDTARKIHSEAKKQETQAETTHSTTRSKLEEEIGSVKKQLQDSVADDKGREQETRKVRCSYHNRLHIRLWNVVCYVGVHRKLSRGNLKWITG